MKLFLEFEPCKECDAIMKQLSNYEFTFTEDSKRIDESARFLRHLTYNHDEVVKAVVKEIKLQKRSPEFDLYK